MALKNEIYMFCGTEGVFWCFIRKGKNLKDQNQAQLIPKSQIQNSLRLLVVLNEGKVYFGNSPRKAESGLWN